MRRRSSRRPTDRWPIRVDHATIARLLAGTGPGCGASRWVSTGLTGRRCSVVAPVNPAAAPPQLWCRSALEAGAAAPAVHQPGVMVRAPSARRRRSQPTCRYKYAMGAIEIGHRYDAIGPHWTSIAIAPGYYQVMGRTSAHGPTNSWPVDDATGFLNSSKRRSRCLIPRFGRYLTATDRELVDAANMVHWPAPLAQERARRT